jgi:hypothetical protein
MLEKEFKGGIANNEKPRKHRSCARARKTKSKAVPGTRAGSADWMTFAVFSSDNSADQRGEERGRGPGDRFLFLPAPERKRRNTEKKKTRKVLGIPFNKNPNGHAQGFTFWRSSRCSHQQLA